MPRTAVRPRYGLKQSQLHALFVLREEAAELRASLRTLERVIDDQESNVLDLLTAHASVEPGPIIPTLRDEVRRIVKWKEEYIKELGFEKAQELSETVDPHVRTVLDLTNTTPNR